MAYAYFANKIVSTNQMYHDLMVQLLTDAGWSVWDTQATYTVMRSDGENPDGKYMYVQITNNTATTSFWLGWNNTTHSGSGSVNIATTAPSASLKMFAYANKDGFAAFQTTGTTLLTPHGILKAVPPSGSFTTTITAALGTGASKQIFVADSSQFKVGAAYGIVDTANGKRQSFVCTGVGAGWIVADSIDTTIAADALIGVNVYPVVILSAATSCTVMNIQNPTTGGGVLASNTLGRLGRFMSNFNDVGGAAQMMDYLEAGAGKVPGANKRLINAELFECNAVAPAFYNKIGDASLFKVAPYATSNLFCVGYELNDFDVQAVNQQDSGTSTGSNSSTTLNDTTKTWTTDQWAGKALVLTSGLGGGQTVKIISNSATQLVTSTMDVIPAADSYLIADEAYRVFTLQNYTDVFMREGV